MMGIFYADDDGVLRMTGYARKGYQTTDENEHLQETTEDELASIFEDAKAGGGTLDGAEETIDAAIDDPLGFLDYLIPDGSGNIAFDDGYVREQPGPTTS